MSTNDDISQCKRSFTRVVRIIRIAKDIGGLIRGRRQELKLKQESLAKQIGVTRQWLSAVENGKSGAALGLVLRALWRYRSATLLHRFPA